jgi:hypothetical protein
MADEYRLSHTAQEVDEKLSKIDDKPTIYRGVDMAPPFIDGKVFVSDEEYGDTTGVTGFYRLPYKIGDIYVNTEAECSLQCVDITELEDGCNWYTFVEITDNGSIVDQKYNPISINAQSGKAVAEAIEEALSDISGGGGSGASDLPQVSSEDDGKVLMVSEGKWSVKELPKYDGEYSITPNTDSKITLQTGQKMVDANIVINKIPYFEVTNNSGGITATIGDA